VWPGPVSFRSRHLLDKKELAAYSKLSPESKLKSSRLGGEAVSAIRHARKVPFRVVLASRLRLLCVLTYTSIAISDLPRLARMLKDITRSRIVLFALIGATIGLLLLASRSREPVYQGHRLGLRVDSRRFGSVAVGAPLVWGSGVRRQR